MASIVPGPFLSVSELWNSPSMTLQLEALKPDGQVMENMRGDPREPHHRGPLLGRGTTF